MFVRLSLYLSNSFMRDEHAQRFSWLSLFAQNSSMQLLYTWRHWVYVFVITSTTLFIVAARDTRADDWAPPRTVVALRALRDWGRADDIAVRGAAIMRATDVVRGVDVVRDTDVARLGVLVVRDITVPLRCVAVSRLVVVREMTFAELRDVTPVVRAVPVVDVLLRALSVSRETTFVALSRDWTVLVDVVGVVRWAVF